jgi:thioredoxin reductase
VLFNSNVTSINDKNVMVQIEGHNAPIILDNDLVYIFAGGELPTSFLQKTGVEITKRFGYIVKKHKKTFI